MYISGLQVAVVGMTDGQILMTAPYQVRVVARQKDVLSHVARQVGSPGQQRDARGQILPLP